MTQKFHRTGAAADPGRDACMACCNQISLHGVIDAVALGDRIGDQPTVAVGLLWLGLLERDLGAG